MRSHPSCWNKTLAQLGFRRKRRKVTKTQNHLSRRALFENLEQRQMLSGDPLFDPSSDEIIVTAAAQQPELFFAPLPEFVLIQPEMPQEELDSLPDHEHDEIEPVFIVETIQTKAGPKAVILLNPNNAVGPPSALQQLTLELHDLGRVVDSYDILIDIAEETFREQFLADRVAEVAKDTAEIAPDELTTKQVPVSVAQGSAEVRNSLLTFIGPKTIEQNHQLENLLSGVDQESVEIAQAREVDWSKLSANELASVAKRQSEQKDVIRKDSDRSDFYEQIEQQTKQLKLDRQSAKTDTELKAVAEKEQSFKDLTLLLAKDLGQDLKSSDAKVAQAAQKVRDELVAISNPLDILFAGFNVDSEVERKINNRGDETSLSFVETGQYAFDDYLEIDLGEHQAMIQVTRSGKIRSAALKSVSGSPAVQDGFIDEANSNSNGGSSTLLHVDGTAAAQQESLIRFDLNQIGDFSDPTTIASAALQLTESAAGTGHADIYVWNGLFGGETGSATDWTESNSTWNHVDGTLDLDSKLGEFTQLSDWIAGTTTEVDVSTQVQRALLYGDANGDGLFGAAGLDGDIEAFHLAVTNWDAYVAEYGPRANSPADLIMRTDGGLGDGTVDTDDIADFFRRHGYSQGDYNLDGTVQDNADSGIDGLDWAVFNANYGLENARFSQGDGNFDGVVDDDDFDIWSDRKSEDNLTTEEPEIVLWVRPEDSTTYVEFAAQEHATLDGPTLVVNEQPDLALNKFSVDGSNLVVNYAVLGETFTDVKVQLYKAGSPDTLLHETAVQSGALGSHEVLIATSVLASIVEGDSIYAKVVGTPSSGTQANTANDQLDFEFSTDSTQAVNSLDDAGMDTLLRDKHTLRELLAANESLGWFDTLAFDDGTLFSSEQKTITLGDHTGDGVADQLDIDQDVTISGPGASRLTIDARGQTRGIYVDIGTEVTLSGIGVTDGYAIGHGAGIYNRGDLTLDRISVLNSNAQSHGGGIYNHTEGTLDITSSTIDNNAAYHGGGISGFFDVGQTLSIDKSTVSNNSSTSHSGGLSIVGTAGATETEILIVNSTFSGNTSGTVGGAIRTQTNTHLKLVNTTVTDNTASSSAGGIWAYPGLTNTVHNSIVADNHLTGSSVWATDVSGNYAGAVGEPSTGNLIGIAHSGLYFDGSINQLGTTSAPLDPMLQELQSYGNLPAAHVPQTDSPAIDRADDDLAISYGIEGSQSGTTQWADLPDIGTLETYVDVGSAAVYAGQSFETVTVGATQLAAVTADMATPAQVLVNVITDELDDDLDDYELGDDGISLREAIEIAKQQGVKEIIFDETVFSGQHTILLGDADGMNGVDSFEVASPLAIDTDVTITGPGVDHLTIDANGPIPVFGVNGTPAEGSNAESIIAVTIEGLGVTGSDGGFFGGIQASTADLTLRNVSVFESSAAEFGSGVHALGSGSLTVIDSTFDNNGSGTYNAMFGGGVYTSGPDLTIIGSTISNNTGVESGGVTFFGDGNLLIQNSTITTNSAIDSGGLYAGIGENSDARVINSTIVENTSNPGNFVDYGGGIVVAGAGSLAMHNNIVAGNFVGINTPLDVRLNTSGRSGSEITSSLHPDSSHNLIGDANSAGGLLDISIDGVHKNLIGISPQLATLGDYGGPTQTHKLLAGSPAIDAGGDQWATSAGLTTDQRGFQRIFDDGDDNPTGDTIDIGAFELTSHIVVDSSSDEDDGNYSAGQLTLREALSLSASTDGTETITFASTVSHIALDNELLIEDNVIVQGPGAVLLTIDADASANDSRRVFEIASLAIVEISGVTITGGYADGGSDGAAGSFGGGISSQGDSLTLRDVAIVENISRGAGGAIYSNTSSLTLESTEILRNESINSVGGGIYAAQGSLIVRDGSAVSGNASAGGGGGIFTDNSSLELSHSELSGNTASVGGGVRIYLRDQIVPISITDTLITGNVVTAAGGGVFVNTKSGYSPAVEVVIERSVIERNIAKNAGGLSATLSDGQTLNLTDSVIDQNVAEDNLSTTTGGGIWIAGSPSTGMSTGTVNITRTTISRNISRDTEPDVPGATSVANRTGGLFLDKIASATIDNSTISQNVSDDDGGGIHIKDTTANFVHATIAFNETLNGVVGGILVENGSQFTTYNSILAENQRSGQESNLIGPISPLSYFNLFTNEVELSGVGQPIPLNEYLEPGEGAGLGILADYGGAVILPGDRHVETHSILSNSRARDNGNAGIVPGSLPNPTSDQRGYLRYSPPGSNIPDIGAYEFQREIASADFNGDGYEDHVSYENFSDTLDVILGGQETPGSSEWAKLDPASWVDFHTGDFNGDGRDDLAFRRNSDDQWYLAFSESSRFVVHATGETRAWLGDNLYVGDFDGDGVDELLGRNTIGGNWQLLDYEVAAGATVDNNFGSSLTDSQFQGNIYVGDVNRDDRDDLVGKKTNGTWNVSLSVPTGGSFELQTAANWQSWFNGHLEGGVLDTDAPLRLVTEEFAKVYNNVELELYAGIKKGPDATEQTKGGNPWDQAALLVQRLSDRITAGELPSNLSPQIVSGRITVSKQVAKDWLGVKSTDVVDDFLTWMDMSITTDEVVVLGDNVTFDHAWVQVQLPTETGLGSVDLDPSWKFKDYRVGISLPANNDLNTNDSFTNGLFDEFKFLDETVVQDTNADLGFRILPDTPLEFFEGEVQQWLVDEGHLGKSLSDVAYDGPIKEPVIDQLPIGLGTEVTATTSVVLQGTFTDILQSLTKSNAVTHRSRLTVIPDSHIDTQAPSWSYIVNLPEHALTSFTIRNADSNPGANQSDVTTTLLLNGVIARNTPISNLAEDVELELYVEFYAPGQATPTGIATRDAITSSPNYRHREELDRDRIINVAVDTGQYSLANEADKISSVVGAVNDSAGAGVDDFDELLALATTTYLRRYHDAIDAVSKLAGAKIVSGTGIVIASSPRTLITEVIPDFDMQFSPYGIVPSDLRFDRVSLPIDTLDYQTASYSSEVNELVSWQHSALQQDVLSPLIHAEGVSTVRLMQRAFAGQDMHQVDLVPPNFVLREADRDAYITVLEMTLNQQGEIALLLRGHPRSSFSTAKYFSSKSSVDGGVIPAVSGDLLGEYPLSTAPTLDTFGTLSNIQVADVQSLRSSIYSTITATSSTGTGIRWDYSLIGGDFADWYPGNLGEIALEFAGSIGVVDNSVVFTPIRITTQSTYLDAIGWSGTSHIIDYNNGKYFRHVLDRFDADEQFETVTISQSGDFGSGVSSFKPGNLFESFANSIGAIGASQFLSVDGAVRERIVDIDFPSVGMPLDFVRHYNSTSEYDIGLGVGWTHSFSDRLIVADLGQGIDQSNPDFIWLTAEGTQHRIMYDSGSYKLPSELLGTLSVTPNNVIYKARDGMETHFDRVNIVGQVLAEGDDLARLDKKVDVNGVGLKVIYSNLIVGTNISNVVALDANGGTNYDLRLQFYYPNGADQIGHVQKHAGDNDDKLFLLQEQWDYNYVEIDGKKYLSQVDHPNNNLTSSDPIQYNYEYYDEDDGDAAVFNGLLEKATQPNGNEMGYAYYPNGRLFQSTDGTGAKTTYVYDPVQGRTFVRDANGNEEIFSYNKEGLVTRQIHADRTRTETVWGVPSSATTVDPEDVVAGTEFLRTKQIDEVGATQTFSYYGSATGFKERELHEVKSKHFLKSNGTTVVGQSPVITQYDYVQPLDDNGQTIAGLVRPLSITINPVAPVAEQRQTTFTYDTTGRLASTKDAEDNTTLYEYFDTPTQKGLLKSKTDPRGTQDGATATLEATGDTYKNDSNFESVIWQPLVDVLEVPAGESEIDVTLKRDSGETGSIVADALRLDLLNDVGAIQSTYIIDNSDAYTATTAVAVDPFRIDLNGENVTVIADATGFPRYGGDLLATSEDAISFIWSFRDLEEGTYRLSATWDGNNSQRALATYRTYIGGLPASADFSSPVNQANDPSGFNAFTTSYVYNSSGLVTETHVAGKPTSTLTYHHTGGLETATDSTGRVTESTYDVLGRLQQTVQSGGPGVSDDLVTTYKYDASGQLEETTDPLGRISTLQYDTRGILIGQTFADGTSASSEFDGVGNRISSTDELGRVTQFVYDSRNRLVQTIYANGTSDRVEYDGIGRVVATIDALGRETHFEYDARGQLVKTTFPEANIGETIRTVNKYNLFSDLVEMVDAENNVTQYVYDDLGRAIQSRVLSDVDVAANIANIETAATTVSNAPVYLDTTAYDPNGNVLRTVVYDVAELEDDGVNLATFLDNPIATADDIENRVTGWESLVPHVREVRSVYDTYNRAVETILVDAAISTSSGFAFGTGGDVQTQTRYDAAGRVLQSFDEMGRVTELVYDAYGRLVTTILPDPDGVGTDEESPVSHVFFDAIGNVISSRDAEGRTTNFNYDARNRLISTVDALGATYSTVYDKAGQIVATIDALGNAAALRYDERGRVILESALDPDGNGPLATPRTSYDYDEVGNLKFVVNSLGTKTGFTYDDLNRLETETTDISFVADDSDSPNPDPNFGLNGLDRPYEADSSESYGGDYTDVGRLPEETTGTPPRAIWDFTDMDAGNYRVSITWLADASLDTMASVEISTNDGVTYDPYVTNTLDQTKSPKDLVRDYQGSALAWGLVTPLLTLDAGDNVKIRLVGSSDAVTIRADAVMLERIDATLQYAYNPNGTVKTVTDVEDRVTEFTYDELDRLTESKLPDPDGGTEPLSRPVTINTYDGFGNLLTTAETRDDALVRHDSFVYDQRNRLAREQLDDENRTSSTSGTSLNAENYITKYYYDDVGNLGQIRVGAQLSGNNPEQIVTRYEYDNLDRLKTQIYHATEDANSADRLLTQTFFYDAVDNLLTQTDQIGNLGSSSQVSSTFKYDDADRLVGETRDAGGSLESTTRFKYDLAGNLLETTDPTGRVWVNEYDDLYRLMRSIGPDEDPADGQPSSLVDSFGYDSIGNLVFSENAEGNTTRYVYDSLGRSLQMIDGRGYETRYTYDSLGNLKALIDPNYNITQYEYDDLDRLTNETNFNDGNPASRSYFYNDDGTLRSTIDREGRIIQYKYDGLSRLLREQWFDAADVNTENPVSSLNWLYDIHGRVTYAGTRAGGASGEILAVETYEYDKLDRLTTQRNWDATPAAEHPAATPKVTLTYQYDQAPSLSAQDNGWFDTVITQSLASDGATETAFATTFYSTDRLGRLDQINDLAANNGNASDDIDSKLIDLSYDAADRMLGIDRSSAGLTFDTSYRYDAAGRLQGIDHLSHEAFTSFSSYVYGYDNASRINSLVANTSAGNLQLTRTETFTYEQDGQLDNHDYTLIDNNGDSSGTGVDLSITDPILDYEYDDAGNREYVDGEIGENNRIEAADGYSYTHDDEGNLTARFIDANNDGIISNNVNGTDTDITEYRWDHRNRLVQVLIKPDAQSSVSKSYSYVYNTNDLRVRKQSFTSVLDSEHYVYDGGQLALVLGDEDVDPVTGDADPDGIQNEVRRRYLHGPGVDSLLVDEVFDEATGDYQQAYWAANDHAGSVRDVIDGSGDLVNHLEYDAFGEITHAWDDAELSVIDDLATDIAFAGRERDVDSGLYYNRARWYDAALGRFISEDPIGYGGDASNLYRYAGNDPVNFGDPSGLFGDSFGFQYDFGYDINFQLNPIGNEYLFGSSFGSDLNFQYNPVFGDFSNPFSYDDLYSNSQFLFAGGYGNTTTASSLQSFGPDDILNALSLSSNQFREFTYSIPGEIYEDIVENQLTAAQYAAVSAKLGANSQVPTVSTTDAILNALGVGVEVVGAGIYGGVVTGGKAVTNAGASSLSLGFYEGPFEANAYDIAMGYNGSRAFAGVSGEILVGVGTGGLASAGSKIGKAALVYDTASNLVGLGSGVNNVIQEGGLTYGNSLQIGGSLLGVSSNVATGGQAFAELASDASRIRVDPRGVYGGVPIPKVTVAPTKVTGPANVRVRTGPSGELQSAFAKIEPGNIGQGTATNASSTAFARRLGNATDDAGHAVGRNLGGSGGVRGRQIFPQAPSVNRGAFNQFEQQIVRRVEAGDNVFVRVVPQYTNGSTRPTSILYQARINGQTVSRTFKNP